MVYFYTKLHLISYIVALIITVLHKYMYVNSRRHRHCFSFYKIRFWQSCAFFNIFHSTTFYNPTLNEDRVASHVKWAHCHNAVAHAQVADAGYGLQSWRVAAKTMNEQSWRADKEWPSCFGVGFGVSNFSSRKTSVSLEVCYIIRSSKKTLRCSLAINALLHAGRSSNNYK